MVGEFGVVPPHDVLDASGYKAIYNDALMAVVNAPPREVSSAAS